MPHIHAVLTMGNIVDGRAAIKPVRSFYVGFKTGMSSSWDEGRPGDDGAKQSYADRIFKLGGFLNATH